MIIRNDMNLSYIRAFNASPDAPAVDIYIYGAEAFKNLKFKDFTEYITLPMGEYKMEVYQAGQNETPVLTESIKVGEREVITIVAAGNYEDLQIVSYIEGNAEDLPVNKSKVRIIHLSPDSPNVDVFVNGVLAFEDVVFLDATDYAQLSSGTYEITVNLADTNDNVLSLNPELKSQKVYTIYIVGNPPNLSGIQSLDGSTFIRF